MELDREMLDQIVAPYATLCQSIIDDEGERILEVLLKAHFPWVGSGESLPYQLLAKYALCEAVRRDFEIACHVHGINSKELVKTLKGSVAE